MINQEQQQPQQSDMQQALAEFWQHRIAEVCHKFEIENLMKELDAITPARSFQAARTPPRSHQENNESKFKLK